MVAQSKLTNAPTQNAGPDREKPEFRQRRTIQIHRAEDFLRKEFPPLKMIIPGLLPEGAVLLAGAPKVGKSRLALALAAAVATGGLALGKIRVPQREVLYLSLEDGERRTQARLKQALGEVPPHLDLAFEWPTVGGGCIEGIRKWIETHPRAGLVVVDVLKRIRPQVKGNRQLYEVDYEAAAPLADLAHECAISILIVHHTRKPSKDGITDPLEEISGSTGLTGAVDGALVLTHRRHSHDGTLELIHRDLPDARFALGADDETGTWLLLDEAPELKSTAEDGGPLITPDQRQYLDLLRQRGPMRPKDIAAALYKSPEAVRQMLHKLANRGLLASGDGLYWVPASDAAGPHETASDIGDTGAHTAHSGHAARPNHGDDGNQSTHIDHGTHTPSTRNSDGRERVSGVSTLVTTGRSQAASAALAEPTAQGADGDDEGRSGMISQNLPVHEPGLRTPTSKLPFKRGWRSPWTLNEHKDNTSRRLDFDTGCRTEVRLDIEPWPGNPRLKSFTVQCGHGGVEEVVGCSDWDDEDKDEFVKMALAHHAYMCACDCIRPLWRQYFGQALMCMTAETPLWDARALIVSGDYTIQTRYLEQEGPPADRWVVTPEPTWDESEEAGPEG